MLLGLRARAIKCWEDQVAPLYPASLSLSKCLPFGHLTALWPAWGVVGGGGRLISRWFTTDLERIVKPVKPQVHHHTGPDTGPDPYPTHYPHLYDLAMPSEPTPVTDTGLSSVLRGCAPYILYFDLHIFVLIEIRGRFLTQGPGLTSILFRLQVSEARPIRCQLN